MMNKFILKIILISLFCVFILTKSNAQCIDLVKDKGFTYLDTSKYVPEARFNSLPLREGDDLDIYKSFFKGRKYRIVVVAAENMPKLSFKVTNFQRQVHLFCTDIYDINCQFL